MTIGLALSSAPPLMVIDAASDDFIAGSFSDQSPLSSAVAETFLPRNSTVTFSPLPAFPHTGTSIPRCTTMCSANMGGTDTAAPQTDERTQTTGITMRRR